MIWVGMVQLMRILRTRFFRKGVFRDKNGPREGGSEQAGERMEEYPILVQTDDQPSLSPTIGFRVDFCLFLISRSTPPRPRAWGRKKKR